MAKCRATTPAQGGGNLAYTDDARGVRVRSAFLYTQALITDATKNTTVATARATVRIRSRRFGLIPNLSSQTACLLSSPVAHGRGSVALQRRFHGRQPQTSDLGSQPVASLGTHRGPAASGGLARLCLVHGLWSRFKR